MILLDWLTNVVMLRTQIGLGECLFTIRSQQSMPKQYFLAQKIDHVVDSTEEYVFLSFMNSNLGFH